MIQSRLTSKGQTTIPLAVRKALELGPHDRLVYEIEDDKVTIRPMKGDIFQYKGSIEPKQRPEDFHEIRRITRDAVARRGAER